MSNHYFGISDPGKVRDNNEDAFLVEAQQGSDRILAAVIDGVGGYEGGEIAAAVAKDCIAELLTKTIDDPATQLNAALIETNRRIIEARKRHTGREKMACVMTLALADAATNQFYYAHVGDTRLYLLRGQSLVKVSKDHSFVGFLEESNRITEQNAMRHPKRNEVNKVLGSDLNIDKQQDYIDSGSSPFLPGDMLLLCSDGLSDMIGSREITEILTGAGSLAGKAQALVNAANEAGGKDNVTVVLVQNPNAPISHEPTPVVKKKPEEAEQVVPAAIVPERSKSIPLTWILSIVCLSLTAVLIWKYLQRNETKHEAAISEPAPTAMATPRQRNATEQQLLSSLSGSTDSLVLDTATFRSPILITDTLSLAKDSFYFSGNGMVLRGDSINGPGLILPATAQYIFLDNIVFENFPIAILANSNALRLRNVRFINCGVPISYAFRFPDSTMVHGFIHESFPFKADTIPDNQ